jgi:hypothetical protein
MGAKGIGVGLAILAAAVAVVLVVTGWPGREGEGSEIAPPEGREATETVTPREEGEVLPREEDRELVTPGSTSDQPPSEDDDAALPEDWRTCLEEDDEPSVTACLERWVAAKDLDGTKLAALVCLDRGEVDEDERWLARLAAARWDPEAFFANVNAFQTRCDDLGSFWIDFLDARLAADPAWHAAAMETLGGEHAFDGSESTAILELVARAAAGGDGWMQAMLESGARGELGGSDAQVSAAIGKAMEGVPDASLRLGILRSILDSPEFGGRAFETDALVGALLDRRTVRGGYAAEAHELTCRLLNDPRLGPRAARHLLVLAEWDTIPAAYSSEQKAALVSLARRIAPPDDGRPSPEPGP